MRTANYRIASFDALRGIAILAIIFFHYGVYSEDSLLKPVLRLTQAGWMGVDMTFALSGFLLAQDLKNKTQRPLLSRWKRMLPLYYTVLLLVCIGHPFFPDPPYRQLFDFTHSSVPYFLLIQNFSIGLGATSGPITMGSWAIASLIQSQLALAALFALPFPATLRRGALVAIPVGLAILRPYLNRYAAYVAHVDGLFLGAFVADLAPRPSRLLVFLGMATLALIGLLHWAFGFTALTQSPTFRSVGYLAAGLGAALLLGHPSSVPSYPPLGWLGRNSLPLFLFHQGINGWAHALFLKSGPQFSTWPQLATTATAFATTLALTWAISLPNHLRRWGR